VSRYLRIARDTTSAETCARPDEINERNEESPRARMDSEVTALGLSPLLLWIRVSRDKVEASRPPEGWDGTLCANCSWPDFCRALGPRNALLPGGPCPAYPSGTVEAHDAN
jgi:hypothetical protein